MCTYPITNACKRLPNEKIYRGYMCRVHIQVLANIYINYKHFKMKEKLLNILLLISIFCLTSCKIEKLVSDNNYISKEISKSAENIDLNAKMLFESSQPPNLNNLEVTTLDDFYYGDIIEEKIIEKKGNWLKLKLTEKIVLNENRNDFILKEKNGWYSFNSPKAIYLIETNLNSRNSIITENTPDISNDFFNLEKNIFTTKPDLLSDKDIDLLISKSSFNFDGLYFKNKRFDYSNFSLGSFYGTIFENCNLSSVNGVRNIFNEGFDFKNTQIVGGINEKLKFNNWKFVDFQFYNTSIKNSIFSNCILSNDADGLVSFLNVSIENSKFIKTNENSYLKNISHFNSKYIKTFFIDIISYNSYFFNTQLINCTFKGGEWNNSQFNNRSIPNKILGGSFINLKINRGNFSSIEIDELGLSKPNFSNIEIKNSNF
jgi:uncharacterized protein YjbI with pentapeptide repeats